MDRAVFRASGHYSQALSTEGVVKLTWYLNIDAIAATLFVSVPTYLTVGTPGSAGSWPSRSRT